MEFELFAAMMFFGFIATEGAVEYLAGIAFDTFAVADKWQKLLAYLSVAVGIFLAFYYQLDLPHAWLGMFASPVGMIITGIVMGRGANAVHQAAQLIAEWRK